MVKQGSEGMCLSRFYNTRFTDTSQRSAPGDQLPAQISEAYKWSAFRSTPNSVKVDFDNTNLFATVTNDPLVRGMMNFSALERSKLFLTAQEVGDFSSSLKRQLMDRRSKT